MLSKNELLFFTQDKNWKSKIFIGGLIEIGIIILPILRKTLSTSIELKLLAFLLEFLAYSIFTGYIVQISNNTLHDKQIPLPNWQDFKKILSYGFKCMIGLTIYTSAAFVILFIIFFPLLKAGNTATITLFGISVAVVALYIFTAVFLSFLTNLKYNSMFNLKLIKKMLSKGLKDMTKLFGYSFVVGLVFFLILTLCGITIVGMILVPFLLMIYHITLSVIAGKTLKNIMKNEQQEI